MVLAVATKADFDQHLANAGSKPVVVDFHAAWCGPCKMIGPKLVQMSESAEFKDKLVFLKVDVDEVEEIAAEYDVTAMPTFLVFKEGKKVETLVGANEAKLREMLKKHSA